MRLFTALFLSALPCVGLAHPHVFVDTGIRVVVDDSGRIEGVEISWTYDDFFSLLVMADLGLDGDGDGALTPEELGQLDGFDMNWVKDYQGDTYLTRNGRNIRLGPPQPRGTTVADGLITTTHFRAASGRADGAVLKAYDPTFYTAYQLVGAVEVTGGCSADVTPADLDAAYTLVEELLYALPTDQAEEAYPEVGERFADTVTIQCK